MSLLQDAMAMQQMCGEGKMMEAFEKYYHENVQVTEKPTGEVREGKEAQRKAIEGWFGMVTEMHGGGLTSLTANEETGVVCAEVWVDATFQHGGRVKMEEVAVQQWKNGQIIEERFYYHMPSQQ